MMAPRLTYAIAPPNQATPLERRREIAAAQSTRIAALPIDALLVYDVQDEGARTVAPRPFPFAAKVDPLEYAFDFLELGALPRIVYRATAGQNEASLRNWLTTLRARGGRPVLVGAPADDAATSLTLAQAFDLGREHTPGLSLGGVLIAERHQTVGGEDLRVLAKMRHGCAFFVSQTVWCTSTTKQLLRDLRVSADQKGLATPPILFTFSPCGSSQTLEFLDWLGVAVPNATKRELLASKDMLARSVELAVEAFAEIRAFAEQQGLTVGCNVESLTARASEIDASLELLSQLHDQAGLGRALAHERGDLPSLGGRDLEAGEDRRVERAAQLGAQTALTGAAR
jgi:hypothetical protein